MDPYIFGDINKLVVNPNDPWTRYIPNKNDGGEILSSSWMQNTYDKLETTIPNFSWETHRIHTIIIYGDKTGTDSRQRYAAEPWMFCHAGIKRQFRNDPTNWRPLGYIPDLHFSSSAYRRIIKGRKSGKSNSHQNYMLLMQEVIRSLEEVMFTGFDAYQRLGDTFRMMRHHVVVCFVMGDSLSNTTLCSTFMSSKSKRICRFCDVTLNECNNHGHRCNFLKMIHLKRLSARFFETNEKEEKEYLCAIHNQLSFYVSRNPWLNLDYGCNPHGLFAATPTDMMHLFDLGIIPYVIELFFESMTDKVKMELDHFVSTYF